MKKIRWEIQAFHNIPISVFGFYSLGNRESLKFFLIMSFKQGGGQL